ncbi:MAG: FAD-dependent oxidoreductase [Marvinbryantia sp.]|jgi:succinate dehydrogenase/fumarate reductase flavoprotein subunit
MYAPYPEYMMESVKKVEATRQQRMSEEPRRLTADEKDALLKKFHPDYKEEAFEEIKIGPNKGQKANKELVHLLHSNSRLLKEKVDLSKVDYDVDVLVIGGGGAGASCAIEAHNAGAKVMVVTKLRIGDANTMMAEGGIQAADKENDSPVQHYLDAFGGGHFAAKPELVKRLVMEAPDAIKWLNELGVEFDKEEDGRMITTHGGGTSRKRMHAAKDYSGAEIMRTVRDEVLNLGIPVAEFTAAVELIKDEKGQAAGAVLLNIETGDYSVARAKTVVIATGGAGRMHYQGFPTSNHYGATADGLIMGYRAGAPLLYQDSIQYHPTGAVYPAQILGALVTEKVRSVGAQLVNANGEAYIHPLETRDVNASGVIRECMEGRGVEVPGGEKGVWLDTPMIELIGGEGTIEKRIPAMFRMYMNYGIDMRKVPILIYPTLHYQNGGLEIEGDGFTKAIPNLLVAGEAVGGIHGRNRLMGNSLLDIIVFGRNAGKAAAAKAKNVELGTMNLDHLERYAEELKAAGVETKDVSPLLLPKYARHERALTEF